MHTVNTKGLGRDQKAVLPFPALRELQDFRSKGAAAPRWSGEAVCRSWLILHGAQCCPEEAEDFKEAEREREGAAQGFFCGMFNAKAPWCARVPVGLCVQVLPETLALVSIM